MSGSARIAQITLYPIKSFDGMEVKEAGLRANGSLAGDREFAFVGPDGNPVDSRKADDRLFKVRVTYDKDDYTKVTFNAPALNMEPATFDLIHQVPEAGKWMSKALDRPVTLKRFHETGIADDIELTGPTLIAKQTLERLAKDTMHEDIHRRLRSNIVLEGLATENTLYANDNEGVPIHMGDLCLRGINPSLRCKVPARDPETGAVDTGFASKIIHDNKVMVDNIPQARSRMERTGYYRLAVNTAPVGEQSGKIAIGDPVEISPLKQVINL